MKMNDKDMEKRLAGLSYYSPSPDFNRKVLAALGHAPVFSWNTFAAGCVVSLMSVWMAALALGAASQVSLPGLMGLYAWAGQPVILIKLYALKAGMLLLSLAPLLELPGFSPVILAQLTAAAFLAAFVLAVISKTKWRTI